ncbi:MAG: hypothetical protein NC416_18750 [Eubacterium sp.]|nr:hypothetical protein [Eubacterium sp.]
MNIALILAGGADPDFQMSVPKQFVNVFNRPVFGQVCCIRLSWGKRVACDSVDYIAS